MSLGRRRSGKATFLATIGFIGPKCRIHYGPIKKRPSCGHFGIKRWRLISGELELHRPPSPNNVLFVCPTRVNESNTNFGTASKLEGHGNGLRSSCTNFAGCSPTITIASTGNTFCLEKIVLRNMAKKSESDIF